MKYIASLVVVEDVSAARYLYETLLGQKVVADYGENLAFEGFSLHKKKHFEVLTGVSTEFRCNGFELYFEEDRLEDLETRLKAEGFEFIHGVVEQQWKQRALRFRDRDGNIIEVGESFEYMAVRLLRGGMSEDEVERFSFIGRDRFPALLEAYGSK